MKKYSLRVLVLVLSTTLMPCPYNIFNQAEIALAAEVTQEEALESDLSKIVKDTTINENLLQEISSDATTIEGETTVERETESDIFTNTSNGSLATVDNTNLSGNTLLSQTIGNLSYSLSANTIDETVPNKEYPVMTITLGVPSQGAAGEEWWLLNMRLHQWLYSYDGSSYPLFNSGAVQFNFLNTTFFDESGKDAAHFFTLNSIGELSVIVGDNGFINSLGYPMNTVAPEFYGHTYTIDIYGSIETPSEYNEQIIGDYLEFQGISSRFQTNQQGSNGVNGDYGTSISGNIRFKVFRVNVDYIDEHGNVLADPKVYGGYTGDTYETKEIEIDGYHLIHSPENASGPFTVEPITVTYIYREDMYSIDARDSVVKLGDKWDPKDNFVSATDRYGDKMDYSLDMVSGTVNTNELGVYTVTYTNATASKSVNITVEEADKLTAEAVFQKAVLGDTLTDIDPKTLVQNVMFEGTMLSPDDYTVQLITLPETSIVGKGSEAKVQVSYDQDSIELTIPVEVLWGNTLLTRGIEDLSSGAYTYHPERKVVTSNIGIDGSDRIVNNTFLDRYYSLNFYRLTKEAEVLNEENLYYAHEVNGQEYRFQAINRFGENGVLNVSDGDIVKVYHAESKSRLSQFIDETEALLSTNDTNEAYLELTDAGYRLLTVDRGKPVEQTIAAGMTHEELDGIVGKSLDLTATKDVSIVGFTQYPDTSVKGTSSGTIRVEENLSTGKKVQYDYDVSFVVEAGDLKISELTNSDFDFGEVKRSSQRQEIQAAGTTAPTITISDYSDTTKWSLYVSASPFVNQKNQELSGAQLTLKDFSLVNTVHQSLMVNSKAIILSSSAQIVAAMTNPEYINGVENGETTLQLGEAKDNLLTGVSLSLPVNTPMDAGVYQATITWELVGDPTL